MSDDLLYRAARKLREPLLCNWDREVALLLADLLERIHTGPQAGVMPSVREYAERVAREILREEA